MDRKLKDPALQRHYDELFQLFAQPGWARFLEDAQRYAAGISNPRNIQSLDHVKGELAALDWLTGFQEMNERAYRMILVDEEAQDALEFDIEKAPKLGRAMLIDGGFE